MKKLFMTNHVGLCNRLDSLCLSFAIQAEHGHQICLDWPENDVLLVDGTSAERYWGFDRIGAFKLQGDTTEIFSTLGQYRRLIQRTWLGPSSATDRQLPGIGTKLRVRADLWSHVQEIFATHTNAPVVGVHIRRGDFQLQGDNNYDAVGSRHPAVPTWWYEYAMASIVSRFPATRFLLACTGDSSAFSTIKKNFDVFELNCPSSFRTKWTGHQSTNHPVLDLFGLASCSTIIGTPLSTFTHYAANLLGPRSTCLLPPLRMEPENLAICQVRFPGRRAADWVDLGRTGDYLDPVMSADQLPVPAPARLDWVRTWSCRGRLKGLVA